jgi:methionyl-tRNA synthetase
VGEDFDGWWDERQGGETEIHHFIGKDITYFHTLFWPAMLKVSRFSLPRKIHIHGFLTVDGEKMSKSKGTFVLASTYLKYLDPSLSAVLLCREAERPRVDDIDLNLDEFAARVNSDIVGNIVNLASRTARFSGSSGREDRGGVFASRLFASHAIDHGARRRSQRVRRERRPVDLEEGPHPACAIARSMHRRAEPLPSAVRLLGAGIASVGSRMRGIASVRDHRMVR